MKTRVTVPAAAILVIGLLGLLARISDTPLGDPARSQAAERPLKIRPTDSPVTPVRLPPQAAASSPPARATAKSGAGAADVGEPAAAETLAQDFALAEALSKNASSADAYVDRLCAESAAQRERPALSDFQARERDAAAFMAPLIDYEKPLDNPPGLLHLADELRERITSYGSEWPMRITDTDLSGLDFTWMTALGSSTTGLCSVRAACATCRLAISSAIPSRTT